MVSETTITMKKLSFKSESFGLVGSKDGSRLKGRGFEPTSLPGGSIVKATQV